MLPGWRASDASLRPWSPFLEGLGEGPSPGFHPGRSAVPLPVPAWNYRHSANKRCLRVRHPSLWESLAVDRVFTHRAVFSHSHPLRSPPSASQLFSYTGVLRTVA